MSLKEDMGLFGFNIANAYSFLPYTPCALFVSYYHYGIRSFFHTTFSLFNIVKLHITIKWFPVPRSHPSAPQSSGSFLPRNKAPALQISSLLNHLQLPFIQLLRKKPILFFKKSHHLINSRWTLALVLATTAVTLLTRPRTAPRRVPLPATTVVVRATSTASAPTLPRSAPATAAASPATFLVSAPRLPRATASAVPPVVPRSATSVATSATLPATAPRVVAPTVVASAATPTVVAPRPATPAVDSATWPVTAPRDRSATTAARSATSPVTAPPRPVVSVSATSASSPATSRLPALTTKKLDLASIFLLRSILYPRDSEINENYSACATI